MMRPVSILIFSWWEDVWVRSSCLIGLLSVLLVSGFYLFQYSPLQKTLAKQKVSLQEYRQMAQSSEFQQRQANIIKQYETTIISASNKLEHTYRNSELIAELSELLARSNLVVRRENYSKAKMDDGFIRAQVELKLEGGYLDLRLFITEIDSLSYLSDVYALEIDVLPSGEVLAELTLTVISRKAS